MTPSRARALCATSRKRIGVAALSGAERVTHLARRHGTSRKFVRAQRERAGHALDLAFAEKLRRASPHRMRHLHATQALENGADLTAVRDNLRHASIATTSVYLHSDDVRRTRQIGLAFAALAG